MYEKFLIVYLAISIAKFWVIWNIVYNAQSDGFKINGKRELLTRSIISALLWPYTLLMHIIAAYKKGD